MHLRRSASRTSTYQKSQAIACQVSVKGICARSLAEEQHRWAHVLLSLQGDQCNIQVFGVTHGFWPLFVHSKFHTRSSC